MVIAAARLLLPCAALFIRFKEDVALMKAMGVKYYRMSFAWSRLFPTARARYGRVCAEYVQAGGPASRAASAAGLIGTVCLE